MLEFEWILTTFELHAEFVAHEIPMSVEDGEGAICQVALVVDGDVGELGVLAPMLVEDQEQLLGLAECEDGH